MEEENIIDGKLPMPADPFLEKLKNSFLQDYEPTRVYKEGVIFMSTSDIYNLFYSHYPNPFAYSQESLSTWLFEKGFHYEKMGDMKYEWLLHPNK